MHPVPGPICGAINFLLHAAKFCRAVLVRSTGSTAVKVLLVEDNQLDAESVEITLERHRSEHYEITNCATIADALATLTKEPMDIVLLDINLPDAVGEEAVREIIATNSRLPIVVLSGVDDERFATEMVRLGAQDYLLKGVGGAAMLPRVMRYAVERKAVEQRLRYLAAYDSLTEVANRQEMYQQIDKACAHADRHGDLVGVVLIDIDRFKIVNDTYGHAVGDAYLKCVARKLEGCLRRGDTLARLGGDEFAALLEGLPSSNAVHAWAKKARAALEVPFTIDGISFSVSASLGISIYPSHGSDVDTLFKKADIALYQAKESDGDSYRVFEDVMDNNRLKQQAVESELRTAIGEGELELFYQPIVDLETGAVTSMEALCRWYRGGTEYMKPIDFLGVATASKMMGILGGYVLRTAIEQCAAWGSSGCSGFPIAVNIDAQQFGIAGFAGSVIKEIERAGLTNDQIEIEITESTLLEPDKVTSRNLHALREASIVVCLDDFGAGHSSLAYIQQFPFDVLKLDRSLVDGIGSDKKGSLIARTIITLARELGFLVVGEGVETRRQFHMLGQFGCHRAQGYLIARPMPAHDVLAWLENRSKTEIDRLNELTGRFPLPAATA